MINAWYMSFPIARRGSTDFQALIPEHDDLWCPCLYLLFSIFLKSYHFRFDSINLSSASALYDDHLCYEENFI